MEYKHKSRLNGISQKKRIQSNSKIKEVIYDQQITQQWKVKTNDPSQILPYSLRHLYLSRLCDFWYQMKFLYFQNYQQDEEQQVSENQQFQQEDEDIVISTQTIQLCKNITKVIWKLSRQRLLFVFNKIRQEASFYQQQSSQMQGQNLDSYMRFLKLRQGQRLESAIQNIESVFEKNRNKKTMEAFINMKQQNKRLIRREVYRDQVKMQCFTDIYNRFIEYKNRQIMNDCLIQIIEFSQSVKIRWQRQNLQRQRERRRKEAQQRKKQQQQNKMYKSVSNKKWNGGEEHESINRKETVNKNENRNQVMNKDKIWYDANNASTAYKKQSRENEDNLNIKTIISQYNSNVKSLNKEEIYQSHYYYEDQTYEKQHENNSKNQRIKNKNLNQLPTHRVDYNLTEKSDKYVNQNIDNRKSRNGIISNFKSEVLNSKSQHTSQFTNQKQTFNSNQIKKTSVHQMQNGGFSSKNYENNHDTHMPITQRIQRQYYQEDEQQQIVVQQSSSVGDQEGVQHIYIVHNYNKRPKRKPDQYVKIPVVSQNINLVEILASENAKYQEYLQSNLNVHSTSYYQRKACQNCQYCLKLKRVKDFVSKIYNESSLKENKVIMKEKNEIEISVNKQKRQNIFGSVSENQMVVPKINIKKEIEQSKKEGVRQEMQMGKYIKSKIVQNTSEQKGLITSTIKSTERKLITRKPMY